MSARNKSRASEKRPRTNSLCARSKARRAAASSSVGWRGGGAGGRAADLPAVVARAGCFLAAAVAACAVGAVPLVGFAATAFAAGRAGVLTADLDGVLTDVLLFAAAGRNFALADLGCDAALVFVVEAARGLFFVDFAVEAEAVLVFVALRTGAFSALERLASGFGRGEVFAPNLRFLAGEALEPLPVTGREDGLFALLLTDSLMRSSIIKMTQFQSR
jgi:hypothetical protein